MQTLRRLAVVAAVSLAVPVAARAHQSDHPTYPFCPVEMLNPGGHQPPGRPVGPPAVALPEPSNLLGAAFAGAIGVGYWAWSRRRRHLAL